jgi:hypothetical protein
VDRPARGGGPSALASRTVRPATADRPRQHRGPSGLLRGQSVKTHRTNRDAPRITDCPPGTRGPSTPHTRTVRNFVQPKLKATTDRNERRARTRRTPDEHCSRGPSAYPSRTVRQAWTELKTARPRKSTPPNHHRISQTFEAVETRVWGLEKRHTRML